MQRYTWAGKSWFVYQFSRFIRYFWPTTSATFLVRSVKSWKHQFDVVDTKLLQLWVKLATPLIPVSGWMSYKTKDFPSQGVNEASLKSPLEELQYSSLSFIFQSLRLLFDADWV